MQPRAERISFFAIGLPIKFLASSQTSVGVCFNIFSELASVLDTVQPRAERISLFALSLPTNRY